MFNYPHDRGIQLGQKRINNEYFYTAVVTLESDEKKFYKSLANKNFEKPDVTSPAFRSESKQTFDFDLGQKSKEFTSIVIIDITDDMQFVYSQAGLLINSFDFSHLTKKYGKPVATSSNGQQFAFMRSLSFLQTSNVAQEEIIREAMKVHIIQMSVFGLVYIKSVDVYKAIQSEKEQIIEKKNWIS